MAEKLHVQDRRETSQNLNGNHHYNTEQAEFSSTIMAGKSRQISSQRSSIPSASMLRCSSVVMLRTGSETSDSSRRVNGAEFGADDAGEDDGLSTGTGVLSIPDTSVGGSCRSLC